MKAPASHGRGTSGIASRRLAGERRVALYGGTFDPIHSGHLAVVRAAERRFHLDEIHFIPAGRPPHKHSGAMASYPDRYAMVALACAGHSRFIASLAESGADHSGREIFYSVDTVKDFKRKLRGAKTHLYFIVGADSFLQIRAWREYETLLGLCDFIVASRPGFRLDALRMVIPPGLFVQPTSAQAPLDPRTIALRHTSVHILDTVSSHVSATEVRRCRSRNEPIRGLVPPRVEEYITKQALYQ